MENNAHLGESRNHRLARLQDGAPVEAILTLLNSISNFFNNEIRIAPENGQASLLFLGIHASALTISKALFGKTGKDGYKKFLEAFVDGETEETKFSLIAEDIHDWRNVLAHQWLGSIGHQIGYDYGMASGWKRREDVLFINPKIYCEKYLEAFSSKGRIWDYHSVLSDVEQEQAKERIVKKYQEM